MSRHAVRAIDVGFGNTKFISREGTDGVHCDLFPSIAPRVSTAGGLGDEISKKRMINIKVGESYYTVGKDASLALEGVSARTLDPTFSQTNEYMALVRGALNMMGATDITLLVVGLPISTIRQMGPTLEGRLAGTHHLPPYGSGGHVCNVHRVKAIAQPLGAFIDFATRTQQTTRMERQRNLIIDIGYFTVDWLLCDGLKVIEPRSDAYEGGMSTIVRAIIRDIEVRHGPRLTDHTKIDEALRTGHSIMANGKEVPLAEIQGVIENKTLEAASAVVAGIGTFADVENIVLAGGGADLYLPALTSKFGGREIKVVRDPVFANVRGFQLAGNQFLQSQAKVVA